MSGHQPTKKSSMSNMPKSNCWRLTALAEELWQAVAFKLARAFPCVTWPTYEKATGLIRERSKSLFKSRVKVNKFKDLSRVRNCRKFVRMKNKSEIADKEVVKVISVPNKLLILVCLLHLQGDFNQVCIRHKNAIVIKYKEASLSKFSQGLYWNTPIRCWEFLWSVPYKNVSKHLHC